MSLLDKFRREEDDGEETLEEQLPDLDLDPDGGAENAAKKQPAPAEDAPAPADAEPTEAAPADGETAADAPAAENPAADAPAAENPTEDAPADAAPVLAAAPDASPAEKPLDAENAGEEIVLDDPEFADTSLSRRAKITKIIRASVMGVCGAVFAVCLVLIAFNLYGKFMEDKVYDRHELESRADQPGGLESLKKSSRPGTISDLSTVESGGENPIIGPVIDDPPDPDEALRLELARKQSYIREKQKQNPDVFAVIEVRDTHILYPIVRGTDNEFYLTHDATKGFLSIGAIFLDSSTSTHLKNNYNSVIYGHNIDGGAMFHDVTLYSDPEFFRTHDVYIYTLEGLYIYKPFCYYKPHVSTGYTKRTFLTPDDFVKFAANIASQSMTLTDYTFSGNDRIITLSTCLNMSTTSKYRYVLHAYLDRVIE